MQSYASHLLPSFLRWCSCLLCCSSCSGSSSCTAISLCQLVCFSGLLQPLLYKLDFTVYAWIVCLHCVCWDSMPNFLWPSIGWQHAGIVCLTSLPSDWLTACWDSLFVHNMLGQHVYFSRSMIVPLHAGIVYLWSMLFCLWPLIGQLLMDAFNPIDVNFNYSIAHSSNSLRIASGRQ